jgi:C4-dicarboxylate-specific signal transduction histidine kinase
MLHVELVTVWDVLKLMKPLGGVSAGIAHELNQPLNTIKMGSEFLKMMLDQKEKIPEDQLSQVVDEIDRQVDRASETVNRLRNFDQTADTAGEKVKVYMNDPIRNVIAVLGPQLTLQNIKLEFDLDETIPPVLAHQNRLEQVIYNLLNNARDAICRKQDQGFETDNHVIRVKTFIEKTKVGVSISDTGVGIPKNMMDRVFEPFFTCDEKGCSMGLGLSITYGIVKGYEGKIQILSEEGIGTTVTMLFPFSSSKLDELTG